MPEYFIFANSFAAPFFSDDSTSYISAETPQAALTKFAAEYSHPCGLYAAICYASADAMHKKQQPLAKWLCNHEIVKGDLTKELGGYSYLGEGPGRFRINDEWHNVPDPKGGALVAVS